MRPPWRSCRPATPETKRRHRVPTAFSPTWGGVFSAGGADRANHEVFLWGMGLVRVHKTLEHMFQSVLRCAGMARHRDLLLFPYHPRRNFSLGQAMPARGSARGFNVEWARKSPAWWVDETSTSCTCWPREISNIEAAQAVQPPTRLVREKNIVGA